MNKKLKKLIATALCGAIMGSPLMLTACNDQTTPNPDPGLDPNPPIVTPIDPPTWSQKAFDIFVAEMGVKQNYKYTITEDGKTDVYDIDGDTIRFREDGDRRGVYWYPEGESFYKLTYGDDSKYHKTNSNVVVAESIVFNSLQLAKITGYNSETGEYTAIIDGKTYLLTVDASEISFYDEGLLVVYTVNNVGNVKNNIPSGNLVVDETTKDPDVPTPPVDPNPPVNPDDPIVTEDKLVIVDEKGNRVYNEKLLPEAVLEALNKETEGKTLFGQIERAGTTVDSIKYISMSEGNIEFGAVTHTLLDTDGFTIFNISESTVETLDTKEKLVNGLVAKQNITGTTLDVIQYSTDSEDATLAANVAKAAKNVANRLAVDGVQDELGKTGTPWTFMQDTDIVFAYTKGYTNDDVGYGIGNVAFIGVKYVAKNSLGEYYFVDSYVVTERSSAATPFEVAYTGNNKKFIVNKATSKQAAKNFYASKTAQKTQVALLPQGKGKGE